MAGSLDIEVSTVFDWNWSNESRIRINRGGTRSTKTYSLSQLAVLWLLNGVIGEQEIKSGVFSVVRKTYPALRDTVMRDVIEIMHQYGLYDLFNHSKVEKTFTYKGRTLEFFSADDQQKVRGRKRRVLWCNEANELTYKAEFYQMLLRTENIVFLDFNPDDEKIWINTELEQKRADIKKDVAVLVSTYKDNPFLTKAQVEEIEYLKETDEQFWKIYGLGQYGNITGLIYPNIETISQWPNDLEKEWYGLDFGFTNDFTAFCDTGVKGRDLFTNGIFYETGLTAQDIIQKFNQLGISKRKRIWADGARPEMIEAIKRAGYRIQAAKKGKGSILAGIDLVKSFTIHVMATALNMQKEFRSYKWRTDKNGDSMNEPLDKFNHYMDALRYGCAMELTKGTGKKRFITAQVPNYKNRNRKQY